jgi:hypothetical protein
MHMTTREAETGRDLSRAHWQRSVGAVVFRELGDVQFTAPPLPDSEIAPLVQAAAQKSADLGDDPQWTTAQSILYHTLLRHSLPAGVLSSGTAIGDGLARHTFYRTPHRIMMEAIEAQVYYPLNLAHLVCHRAAVQGVAGYQVKRYGDIAGLLRRSDLRQMIDQSALTRNGVLQHMTSGGVPPENMASRQPFSEFESAGVLFDAAGSVTFHQDIRDFFLAALRHNNARGLSGEYQVDVQSSSGCPARHKQPHFTGSHEDTSALAALSQTFGKPESELIAVRPQSAIESGLDWMAGMLEHLDTRPVATCSSSER